MGVDVTLTVPVLEQLVAKDPDFLVRLSHAATKQIIASHLDAVVKADVVKASLEEAKRAIAAAQKEAGEAVASQVGKWTGGVYSKFVLRPDVEQAIKAQFSVAVQQMFEEWLKSHALNELVDRLVAQHVQKRFDAILRAEVGEWLRRNA